MAWFIGWFLICSGALFFLLGIFVDPRSLWEATASWKYNNPDANEPSDAEFTSRRALLVIGGVVLVCFGFGANHIASGNLLGLTNSRPALEAVARKLGSSVEVGTGGKIEPVDMKHVSDRLNSAVTDYVRDVNTHGYPAADLSVDELQSADNVYSFNVSAAHATHYCLVVTATGPVQFKLFLDGGGRVPSIYDYLLPISSKILDGPC
ncbi:hypothetical protein [Nocardia sp. NPDC056100]|uniref:hypothetical protein n=1 Tax=Nocardia sp. NPDC056100 TaxID=3345712 RepID=UPI0035DD2956